jgi:hypothetical protein
LAGDPKTHPLGDVHRAALRRARDAIDAEIQRLDLSPAPSTPPEVTESVRT